MRARMSKRRILVKTPTRAPLVIVLIPRILVMLIKVKEKDENEAYNEIIGI